jgi:hypothetical protein
VIIFDEDTDARVFDVEAGTMTAEHLQKSLDTLRGTRTKVLIVGVTNAKANFPSRVVESYLDGFDARLGIHQSALRCDTKPWPYRRCANFQVLFSQGIDSNAYFLDNARTMGVSPWIGVRMNDIHNGHDPDSYLHSDFWRQHPELWCASLDYPCENTLDYSHEVVRERMLAFLVEVLERYHADGLFLDWMRWPSHVPFGKGEERAPLLTKFMRQVRNAVDAEAKRRGHPIKLISRVPLTPENALKRGLDAVLWAREGLLDMLIIGNFGSGMEFDAPVELWHQKIGNAAFPIAVSIENSYSTGMHLTPSQKTTPEDARGVAAAAHHRGACGVHLFNFMRYLRRPELKDAAELFLNDPASKEDLLGKTRRFRLSWDDSNVRLSDLDQCFRIPGYFEKWNAARIEAGLPYPSVLPYHCKSGEYALFRLYTAWVPEAGACSYVQLQTGEEVQNLKIWVNGAELETEKSEAGLFYCKIPAGILVDGWTEVQVSPQSDAVFTDVSVWICHEQPEFLQKSVQT